MNLWELSNQEVGRLLVKDLVFVGIDFEGAGQRQGDHEDPVQIGLGKMLVGGEIPAAECFDSLLRPRRGVTAAARRVHGIGDDDLATAPSLGELWPDLREPLRAGVLVAYGMATEKRYLEGLPGQVFGPWLDVLPLMRAAFPEWENHSLGVGVERLGLLREVDVVCQGRAWHDALFDAIGTLVLLRYLLNVWDSPTIELGSLMAPDLSVYRRCRRNRS